MSTEIDPLDEIFTQPAKNARAGGKFAPKAKPRPKKETSIKLPSSQPVQNIKITESETEKPKENSFDSRVHSLSNSCLANSLLERSVGGTLDPSSLQTDVSGIQRKPSGEEALMNTDVDPLNEIFSVDVAKNARDGADVPPKTKPHPRKETSINQPSVQLVNRDTGKGTEKALENKSNDNLALQVDVVRPDISGELTHKEASLTVDIDPLDEIFTGHAAKKVKGGAKFPPKVKPRPRKETSVKQSTSQAVHRVQENEINKALDNKLEKTLELQVDVVRPDISEELAQVNADTVAGSKSFGGISDQATIRATSETPFPHVSETSNTEEGLLIPDVLTAEGSVICRPNASSVQTCLEDCIPLDATPRDEEVVSDSNAGSHFNDGVLEIEEIETRSCTEGLESIFDMTTQSGQRSRKFQPTPKFQVDARNNDPFNSNLDESQFLSHFKNDDFITKSMPHEGLTGHAETLEKSTKLRERRKISTVCDNSLGCEEASTSGQDNEPDILIKKLRKRKKPYTLVDENEGETHDVGNLEAEHPSGTPLEKENCNDVGNEMPNETQAEKKPKRSRKASSQKEKPARKCKKVDEASDQATQKPRKKFSHSTRQTKRQVNKDLLETPEEDIDMKKLRIRDLILLGEHREKTMSKEGKTEEPPSANKSAGTSFDYNDDYIEDQDFSSEGGQFSNDQPQNSNIFNYHSHMKKTPRLRWSKQDTELFYELEICERESRLKRETILREGERRSKANRNAGKMQEAECDLQKARNTYFGVRQFGSDISMIQQLFPDRTRAQVKMKYKKEERQQPLRLHDALTGRSEDHSHFLRVIEQLKQLSDQEDHNSFDDDPVDFPGNEEATPGINEKLGNLEKAEERENEGVEADPSETQSPLKSSYDSDEELDTWCEYKSEL